MLTQIHDNDKNCLETSASIINLDEKISQVLLAHNISQTTGFMEESPLKDLHRRKDSKEEWNSFRTMIYLAGKLPQIIEEKKVREKIALLPINEENLTCSLFSDLSWREKNLLHLTIGMLAHAWLHEQYPYATVGEMNEDMSIKHLCHQLAVPLYAISKETGAAPTMSFPFYSEQNGWKNDPNEPFSLANFRLLFSFTGSLSEKWFVGIHQVIDTVFSPAIPEYLRAYFLAKLEPEPQVARALTLALEKSAESSESCNDIMLAMYAHCEYRNRSYFDRVRVFYIFPKNVVYDGVTALGNIPQNPFGETGGQWPGQHFRLAVLGAYNHDDQYFPKMRLNMQKPAREFVEMMFGSRVRDFVLKEYLINGNVNLAKAYNRNIAAIISFREIHLDFVDKYIRCYGDTHGTGNPPLKFLDNQIKHLQTKLIVAQ